MRISYERGGLEEVDYQGRDPLTVFDEWFKDAVEQKVSQQFVCMARHWCGSAGRGGEVTH